MDNEEKLKAEILARSVTISLKKHFKKEDIIHFLNELNESIDIHHYNDEVRTRLYGVLIVQEVS